MSNRIEGGSNMGAVDMGAGIGEAAQPPKCTDIAKARPTEVAEAPKKDASDGSMLDQLLDLGGGFWDEVTGAAGRVGAAGVNTAGQGVDIIKKEVTDTGKAVLGKAVTTAGKMQQGLVGAGEELQRLAQDLNKMVPMPQGLTPQAQKFFLGVEEGRQETVRAVDKLIGSHPKEAVRQTALELFNGEWSLSDAILHSLAGAGGTALDLGINFADKVVADGYLLYSDVKQDVSTEFKARLAELGGDFVVEYKDAFQKTGAFLETVLDNDAVKTAHKLMGFSLPMGPFMEYSRLSALKLAGAVKELPDFVANNMGDGEALREALGPKDARFFSKKLEDLEIGQTVHQSGGVSIEGYAGPGGGLGLDTSADCTRVGQNTYEIAVNVEALIALGIGEKMLKEGIDLSLTGHGSGRFTLVVTGENARDDAARLMGCLSNQQISDFVRLKDVDFNHVSLHETTVGTGLGGKIEALGLEFNNKYVVEAENKTINGQEYEGIRFSANPEVSLQSAAGLQVNDALAQDWLNDPKTGNQAVDSVLSQLPVDVVTELKQFYGPTAALDLGLNAKISGAVHRPTGQDEPTRIELEVQASFHAGASTIEATTRIVIPSLEDLAKAMGSDVDALKNQLLNGEFSLEEWQKNGLDTNKFWQLDGPEVVCNRFVGTRYFLPVVKGASGIITPTVIYKRGETVDAAQNLRNALYPEQKQASIPPEQLAADAQAALKQAHTVRM